MIFKQSKFKILNLLKSPVILDRLDTQISGKKTLRINKIAHEKFLENLL